MVYIFAPEKFRKKVHNPHVHSGRAIKHASSNTQSSWRSPAMHLRQHRPKASLGDLRTRQVMLGVGEGCPQAVS